MRLKLVKTLLVTNVFIFWGSNANWYINTLNNWDCSARINPSFYNGMSINKTNSTRIIMIT